MKKAQLWVILALLSFTGQSRADDSSGVIGFVAKDGLFVAADLGIFATVSGYGALDPASNLRKSVTLSGIETMVALTIGFDLSRNFGVGLKLANGSVSGGALSPSDPESPTDFGLYLVDANVMGALAVSNRVRLVANGFGGLTVMSPPAIRDGSPYSTNVGVSVGVLYDTLLADMVVGLNVAGYGFFGVKAPADAKTNFFGASITPVIKYVF